MNTISMTELKAKIDSLKANEIILDVRSEEEYREGHVHGSRNIPHDRVHEHIEELKKYAKVYVHCQAGGRAGRASSQLAQLGLQNIVCISGSGMKDWISAGFPVEKG